jgi:hypothetical protein
MVSLAAPHCHHPLPKVTLLPEMTKSPGLWTRKEQELADQGQGSQARSPSRLGRVGSRSSGLWVLEGAALLTPFLLSMWWPLYHTDQHQYSLLQSSLKDGCRIPSLSGQNCRPH